MADESEAKRPRVQPQPPEDDDADASALLQTGALELVVPDEPDLFLLDWGEGLQGMDGLLLDGDPAIKMEPAAAPHSASAPAVLQHVAPKARPHHTPVELTDELEALLLQVEHLEGRLGNVAANVAALLHAQEPDWPNDTVDGLAAALGTAQQQLERLVREQLLSGTAAAVREAARAQDAAVSECYVQGRLAETAPVAGSGAAAHLPQRDPVPHDARRCHRGPRGE